MMLKKVHSDSDPPLTPKITTKSKTKPSQNFPLFYILLPSFMDQNLKVFPTDPPGQVPRVSYLS